MARRFFGLGSRQATLFVTVAALAGCARRSATNDHAAATGSAPQTANALAAPSTRTETTARVPPFRFTDQRGHAVTDAELRGHVWIFDFVYTSCTSVCPTLTAKFVMLERKLADPELRFVSFAVDPAHDTPEALARYAERFRPDERRWLLLATDDARLQRFAHDVGADVQASSAPNDPIRHSVAFFLVDRDGSLARSYDSTDPSALARLRADAAALAGDRTARPNETAAELVASLGCNGCHARAELAPPLAGLGGQSVELSDGRRVLRDPAYLRESLLEPSSKLVRGYPDRMPAYGAELSTTELDALVVSLMHLPAASATSDAERPNAARLRAPTSGSASSAAEPEIAIDAVCGMAVHVAPNTPQADLAGRRYFFCSDTCRERFKKTPAEFAR